MTLRDELQRARWFGGKSRAIRDALVVDHACWVDDAEISLVEVEYEAGPPETYVLAERLQEAAVARALLQQFGGQTVPTEAGGALSFTPSHLLSEIPRE